MKDAVIARVTSAPATLPPLTSIELIITLTPQQASDLKEFVGKFGAIGGKVREVTDQIYYVLHEHEGRLPVPHPWTASRLDFQ